MARLRRGVHQVNVRRARSLSEPQLEFYRHYLELIFVHLFRLRPAAGSWCAPGVRDFERSVAGRTPPAESAYLADPRAENLRDEAAWHVARMLADLYETQSLVAFSGSTSLVPIEDHRHSIIAGVTSGPRADATANLSLSDWDSVLQDLARSIWVDFLAWSTAYCGLTTPLRELVPEAIAALCARSAAPDQRADAAWFERELSPAQHVAFARSIGAVPLAELDQLLASLLPRYPNDRIQRLSGYRQIREDLIDDVLGTALETLPEFPLDAWAVLYFGQAATRAPIEDRETQRLLDVVIEREYEVVFPLLGQLPQSLHAPAHGLEITSAPPTIEPPFLAREGAVYARVTSLRARAPSDALAQARRRVEIFLAAAGVRSGAGVAIQALGESYHRIWASPDWRFGGETHGLPLSAVAESWATAMQAWGDLLRATDDLGIRIQDALVSLNKGYCDQTARERLQEHWRVFEILLGEAAPGALKSWGYVLLLYRLPNAFGSMSGPDQRAFVDDRVKLLRQQIEGLIRFRGQAVDHRAIAHPDTAVLSHWATVAQHLAREFLSAAITAWYDGVRAPRDVERRIRNGYDRIGVPLR